MPGAQMNARDKLLSTPEMSVRTLIDRAAQTGAFAKFLLAPEGGEGITFAQLKEFSLRLFHHMCALGLGKGDKVAFLLDNELLTAQLFLALMYGGFVVVPLNLVAGKSTLAQTICDSQCRAIFVSTDLLAGFSEVKTEIPRDIHILTCVKDEPLLLHETGSQASLPEIEPDDDALIAYTSGSTGRPKGALFSHASLVAGGNNTAVAHALGPMDRSLLVLPLYHMNAQIVTLMSTLVSGGSVVVTKRFTASTFWQTVRDCRCSWFALVPTIVTQLLEHARANGVASACEAAQFVRFARSSSAPLSRTAHLEFERVFQLPMIEAMGMTEAGGAIFSNPLPPDERKPGSPGIPYGFEVRIANQHGQALGAGEIGELLVRGPSVMKSYFKHLDAECLTADGFIRTGDLAAEDADGFIFIAGRTADVVNKGGEKIAPREIEELILRHPSVLECAITAVEDPLWGQDMIAFVVLKSASACSQRELFALCQKELGMLKTPCRFEFIAQLPRGTAHKVDRKALSARAALIASATAPVSAAGSLTPADQECEAKVIEIMAEVLGHPRLDRLDNFFDLGGYSLLALRLLHRLSAEFNCNVPPSALFAGPTGADLAAYIRKQQWQGSCGDSTDSQRSLVLLSREADGVPVFITAGGRGGEEEFFVYAGLIRHLPDHYACYGLRARASIAGMEPHKSVEQMAAAYIDEIRQVQPTGPYRLLGECSGGVVAYEMARQLAERGASIDLLLLLDCRAPDAAYEMSTRWRWMINTIKRRFAGEKSASSAIPNLSDRESEWRWLQYKKPLLRYRPRRYRGRVTLLLSEEYARAQVQDSWKALSDIELVRLIGDHYGYIREHALANAGALSALLHGARQTTADYAKQGARQLSTTGRL
ncbi:MAG TPA: AMP-binding protein [Planktothrix sp.]